MANNDVVKNAAILEKYFNELKNWDTTHLPDNFILLDVGTFENSEHKPFKAITVQDGNGNIYVHFNGTGDGNWGYNDAAYGGHASDMQLWARWYFEKSVEEYYQGQVGKDLYVTGHSQGGNNAQYVTIVSKYSDYITDCISLDGPGFSQEIIDECINQYGEVYYERQRQKIHAYNGEYDYVSCLGEVQIVPEGKFHTIQTPDHNDGKSPFVRYHAADYLLDKNDNLNEFGTDSAFRKFVIAANEEILNLSPEKRKRAAELTMKIVENINTGEDIISVPFSDEELADFKELIIPVLRDVLADNPHMIAPVVEALGFSPEIAALATVIVSEFNNLSPEDRAKALEELAKCLVLKDGVISFNMDNLDAWSALKPLIPMIWETLLHHPDDILKVLHELGVDKMLMEWLKDRPLAVVALILASPLILTIITDLAALAIVIDAVVHIVQGIVEVAKAVKNFVLNTLQAIKDAIGRLQKFLRSLSPGVRYAGENPYIRVDTGQLFHYANRIGGINSRLYALDNALRGLYCQVGLLDIWDILVANAITSASPTLCQVQSYLTSTAEQFEQAERKANSYMGG